MRNRRRVIGFGLLAAAVIAGGVIAFVVVSGGPSASAGDTRACDAFWAWDDKKGPATAPVLTAYREATTEPLAQDLHDVSDGLKALAREAGHDQTPGQALTENASLSAERDCTSLGVINPPGERPPQVTPLGAHGGDGQHHGQDEHRASSRSAALAFRPSAPI